MTIPFKTDFREAGEYCNLCYLNNLIHKGNNNQKFISKERETSKKTLTGIIESDKNYEHAEIVGKMLSRCKGCKFENPEIFKYLDENEII